METTAEGGTETERQPDDVMCSSDSKNTCSYISLQRDLAELFTSVQKFTDLPDFTKHIREEALVENMKDISKQLDSRMNDLMKRDCAIVVAGETSAGKSSVINLIIGEEILPTDIMATTTRICRLRYSEKLQISTYDSEDKQIKVTPFDDKGKMTDVLSELATTDDGEIKYVDVCLPLEILKGNIIMVDTPGIGDEDQDDVAKMMLEYIPNAVAFVFVVNMGNAGGLQNDRLGRILERIRESLNQMHSFDPKDAIFLLNKWETLRQKNRKTDLFEEMKMKVHNKWKDIEDGFILKFAATEVEENEKFQREFDRFQEILKSIIAMNENKRIKVHTEFIGSFVENCDVVVAGKINCARQNTEENIKNFDKLSNELQDTESRRQEAFDNLQQTVDGFLDETANAPHAYIQSQAFEKRILEGMQSCAWIEIESKIKCRIEEEISVWQKINMEDMFKSKVMEEIKEKFIEIRESLHIITDKVKGSKSFFDAKKKYTSVISYVTQSGEFIVGGMLMTLLSVYRTVRLVVAATGIFMSGLAMLGVMDDRESKIINAYKASIEHLTADNIKQSLANTYAKGLQSVIQAFLEGELKEEIEKLERTVASMRKNVAYYEGEESNLISLSSTILKLRNRLHELENTNIKMD